MGKPDWRAAIAEDSVGRMHDRDEAHLDVIDVEAFAREVGPRRGPVRGGRPPHRVRQVSLAAAAAVIVVGGFAAGGLLGDSAPSSPPDALASTAPCTPIASNSPAPAFRLAGAPGDEVGVRGLPGNPSPRLGGTGGPWQLPGPELSLTVATHRDLRLLLATGVCVAEIEIEAAPAASGNEPDPADRWALLRTTLAPARDEFAFDVPVDNDWVLRIVVLYWAPTGQPARLAEGYFRVRVGDGPFATPTEPAHKPFVTPAVPCGPAPATSSDVVVTLTTGGADPVPGVEPGADLPLITVGLGEAIEIAVAGAACATSWTIDARVGDSIVSIEGVPNVANNLARAAQNVWRFELPRGVEDAVLVVVLRFGFVATVERTWHVTTAPFEVPAAFIVAADGRRVEAHPGCGLGLELANGYTAADECGELGYDGSGEHFEVTAFEVLALEVPGWTIVGWSGVCGLLIGDAGEVSESAGCGLGGYSIESGGSPPPLRFLVPPGRQVVQLWITAIRDGDRFNVPYYARIDAR